MSEPQYIFGGISLGGGLDSGSGALKLSPQGLTWKNKSGKSISIPIEEILAAEWASLRPHPVDSRAQWCRIRVRVRGGQAVTFAGIKSIDQPKFEDYFKKSGKELKVLELSTKGWNWGSAELKGSDLVFDVDGKRLFDVSLGEIGNTSITRADVTLELVSDDTANPNLDKLTEVKLHVPVAADKKSKDDSVTPAQELHKSIIQNADLSATKKWITQFPDILILTPRGRYTMEMYSDSMRLVGKNHNYKINYGSVVKLFLLPKPDGRTVAVVISLDPPVRQGQTAYHHIVMQFDADDEYDIEFSSILSDQDLERMKLPRKYKGNSYEVAARTMKTVMNKRLTQPGDFKSSIGNHGIRCALRANDGFLFPLERYFFWIHKPPTLIRYDDIKSVEFARVKGSMTGRSFDLSVETQGGNRHVFGGIYKNEYDVLFSFLKGKNIKIKNIQEGARNDQVDFVDSEEEGDPYMRRIRKREKREKEAVSDQGEDEDSESDDENFAPAGPESEDESDLDQTITAEELDHLGIKREKRKKKHSAGKEDSEEKGAKKRKVKKEDKPGNDSD